MSLDRLKERKERPSTELGGLGIVFKYLDVLGRTHDLLRPFIPGPHFG